MISTITHVGTPSSSDGGPTSRPGDVDDEDEVGDGEDELDDEDEVEDKDELDDGEDEPELSGGINSMFRHSKNSRDSRSLHRQTGNVQTVGNPGRNQKHDGKHPDEDAHGWIRIKHGVPHCGKGRCESCSFYTMVYHSNFGITPMASATKRITNVVCAPNRFRIAHANRNPATAKSWSPIVLNNECS